MKIVSRHKLEQECWAHRDHLYLRLPVHLLVNVEYDQDDFFSHDNVQLVKATDLLGSFIGHKEEIWLVGRAGRGLERQLSPEFFSLFWYL